MIDGVFTTSAPYDQLCVLQLNYTAIKETDMMSLEGHTRVQVMCSVGHCRLQKLLYMPYKCAYKSRRNAHIFVNLKQTNSIGHRLILSLVADVFVSSSNPNI